MSVVAEQTEVEGIERVPGVCGGYPVIAGTRISVRNVIEYLRVNKAGIDEFLASFPHLRREQVEAALLYDVRYPEVVNEDVKRHRRALEELAGAVK